MCNEDELKFFSAFENMLHFFICLTLSGCLLLWLGEHFTKVSTAPTSFLFHYTSALDVLRSLQSRHSRPSLLPFKQCEIGSGENNTYLANYTHRHIYTHTHEQIQWTQLTVGARKSTSSSVSWRHRHSSASSWSRAKRVFFLFFSFYLLLNWGREKWLWINQLHFAK